MKPAGTTANLGLCLGAGNDSQRSPDEVRIIKEMLAAEIDAFVQENRVDQRAARELMQEPVYVQLMVLDRGALKNCTNPSGAFVARIRDAKKQPPPTPAPLPAQPYPGASAPAMPSAATPQSLSDLERYIVDNRLDHGAATLLRTESPDIQQKVMALGSVASAPNPSASFMIRLRQVQSGTPGGQVSSRAPLPPPPPLAPGVGEALPSAEAQLAAAGLAAMSAAQDKTNGANGAGDNGRGIDRNVLDGEALKAIQMINAQQPIDSSEL